MICICRDAATISRPRAGTRSGWRLVSGSLRTIQFRRARGEECREQQQVAQRAVGQFGGAQGPEQPVLPHGDLEARFRDVDVQFGPGEGIRDRCVQARGVTDFPDRLQRSREVGAVMAELRRVRSDLRLARGRIELGAEVIVEAPGSQALAHLNRFGGTARVDESGHHALEAWQLLSDRLPRSLAVREPQSWASSIDQES